MGVPGQVPTLWQGISPGSLERIVATARSIGRSTYVPHRNLGIGLHHIPGASGFPSRAPGSARGQMQKLPAGKFHCRAFLFDRLVGPQKD
jgi:hypothetical protein